MNAYTWDVHPVSDPITHKSPKCSDKSFRCPGTRLCLPVFARCNGLADCPGEEDESGCHGYTCQAGFYRCIRSKTCVHQQLLCKDYREENICPLGDDARFCVLKCPNGCFCISDNVWRCGSIASAELNFAFSDNKDLRFIEVRNTRMKLKYFTTNLMLIYLKLTDCGINQLENTFLPNLRSLDLSGNNIQSLRYSDLGFMPNLDKLFLSNNPLITVFPAQQMTNTSTISSLLTLLDLSGVRMTHLDLNSLSGVPNLQLLNLSNSKTETFKRQDSRTLPHLQSLDIRGSKATYFSRTLFQGMDQLQEVYTDNFKLCCPVMLPEGFNLDKCQSPVNEISSCESLLRSILYRVCLANFASLSLIGNLGSFFYRAFLGKHGGKSSFGLFVVNLCVADFLMGVYLLVIGLADAEYEGSYLWRDLDWRRSGWCRLAGFLSLASCEVSALVICLITIDRLLVIRFPFSTVRFGPTSGRLACSLVWLAGIALAAVPLLPFTAHWQFYGQTGICIPLPIIRKTFRGQDYSFAVMIVLNFVLFVLIAVGQLSIFLAIRSSKLTVGQTSHKANDFIIARRLLTVVVSDFLCWFPVGTLGLLARRGTAVPAEANAAMAVLVLPLNAALNPFLYTFNVVMEKRAKAREEKLLAAISQ